MTSSWKPKKLTVARIFAVGVLAVIGGIIGYFVGGYVADVYPKETFDALLVKSGVSFFTHLALGAFGAMYLVTGLFALLARYNPRFERFSGFGQFIGSSAKGRRAMVPLAVFYLAYGALMSILAVQTLWNPSGPAQTLVLGVALVSGLAMIITTWQLWTALDELVRAIWLEACAASSILILVAVLIWQVSWGAGLKVEISSLGWIAMYNIVYFVIYMFITAIRAPQMLAFLEEEG